MISQKESHIRYNTYSSTLQSSQEQEAIRHYERAFLLDSNNDPAAEQEYRLAINARGGVYPEALQGLRRLLQMQLRLPEAILVLKDYIDQTPNERHTEDMKELASLENTVGLQLKVDRMEKPSITDFLALIPLIARYGKPVKAVPYAERAVRLYPESAEAHILLASYIERENKEKSLKHFEKAAELEPRKFKSTFQTWWFFI